MKAMWRCPKCGHRFLRRNDTHSCERYRIADHFAGKPGLIRQLYAEFRRRITSFGPVTAYAQKTGIIFHRRHRFALVVVRKNWIDIALCLWGPRKHPALRKIEYFGGRCHRHWFRITREEDMNRSFMKLLGESCEVGA